MRDPEEDFNEAAARLGIDAKRPSSDRYAPWVEVDLADFDTADIPPHAFVMMPYFPRSEVTLVAGNGKSGKSMLMLAIAACIACGAPWGPFTTTTGKVLWLSLEDKAPDVLLRLKKITKAYGLDPAAIKANMTILDGHAGQTELAMETMDESTRTRVMQPTARLDDLRAQAKGADFIVVDSASEANGGSENDRRQVRAFLQFLVAIAENSNAALALTAHVDKPSAKAATGDMFFSGSTAWHNAVRSRLALLRDGDSPKLEHQAATHTAPADPVTLTCLDGGVLWPLDPKGAAASASAMGADDRAAVLAAMAAATSAGRDVTTGRSNAANTWQTLREFPELGDDLRSKGGRQRVFDALTQLERDGKLRRVKFDAGNRNKREYYELTRSALEVTKPACLEPPNPACIKTPIPPMNERTQGERSSVQGLASTDANSRATHERTQPVPDGGVL